MWRHNKYIGELVLRYNTTKRASGLRVTGSKYVHKLRNAPLMQRVLAHHVGRALLYLPKLLLTRWEYGSVVTALSSCMQLLPYIWMWSRPESWASAGIFAYNKWESVRAVIDGCGSLDVKRLISLRRIQLYGCIFRSNSCMLHELFCTPVQSALHTHIYLLYLAARSLDQHETRYKK